jgi:hypothetical protein
VDREAPVITLTGLQFTNWPRWKPYIDPGNTVTDNYYSGLICNPDISGVDFNLEGIYAVKFNITDPSGNKAIEVIRYVIINPAGISNFSGKDQILLYPNPGKGIVSIKLMNGVVPVVKIYDAQGKEIIPGKMEMKKDILELDLTSQLAGLYFLQLRIGNDIIAKSFTIIN